MSFLFYQLTNIDLTLFNRPEPVQKPGPLGSIQLTLNFSVARQRLNVTVHKIM